MGKTCAVFGNKEIWLNLPDLTEHLKKLMTTLVKDGVDLFLCESKKDINYLVCEIADKLTYDYPKVEVWFIDVYSFQATQKFRLTRKNQHVIDQADYIISFLDDSKEAYHILKYAAIKNKTIIKLKSDELDTKKALKS